MFCDLSCPFNINNPNSFTNSRSKDCKFPLPLEDNNSNVLLVFEAPGYYEWENRCPIYDSRSIGKKDSAGSRMAQAFESCDKNRTDYDIAEVVCCFPGNVGVLNHNEILSASIYCRKYLLRCVEQKKYYKIVCWGYIAHNTIIDIVKSIQIEDPHYCPNIMFAKHPTAYGNTQDEVNRDAERCLK